MFTKFKKGYREYPNPFKVLVLATFIDRVGFFLMFPFFALYMTAHFNVGMIEVGLLFTIFSAGNIIGGVIGGALADKYGRRAMILVGLIASGVSSIFMGLVDELNIFYGLAAIMGLLGNFGGPARQAMVADLLPKENQAKGFGVLRVAVNLSATIGPIFGGFIASQSYLFLFIADAVSSLITGIIVFFVIPETKPERKEGEVEETVVKTVIGYKEVLKDWRYVLFLSVSSITVIVYMQITATLSVFLRDVHGFPMEYYGLMVSMNALMVVVFQLWISGKMAKYSPMKVMAVGTLFYMVGFSMYGIVSEPYLFFIAMVIITIGEMIEMPTGQTAAVYFAPEDKRGRYMAIFGFHWAIPNLFGVLLAGLVIEYIGPNWVWYFAGMLSLIAAIGFWLLHGITKTRFSKENEPLDDDQITEEIQKN